MKMKMKTIKSYEPKTGLEKATKKIILNNVSKGYVEGFFEDLMNHGCVSGWVSELVYYSDTVKFFKKHREDINELLKETLWSFGNESCPSIIFGDRFDTEDILCIEQQNQNLLAWFAFEETTRHIAQDLGLEL